MSITKKIFLIILSVLFGYILSELMFTDNYFLVRLRYLRVGSLFVYGAWLVSIVLFFTKEKENTKGITIFFSMATGLFTGYLLLQ